MRHKHRNHGGTMEDITRDDVPDSQCVAGFHRKETNFVSENTEGSKTKDC